MAGRATRAGDRVRGNLGELARALEGATAAQVEADEEDRPSRRRKRSATPRRSNQAKPASATTPGKDTKPKARRQPGASLLAGNEITEVSIPIAIRERASRLMRARATGVPGRGPGARFLIAAYVQAVSSLISEEVDTNGFSQGAEEDSLRSLLDQIAATLTGGSLPPTIRTRVRGQADDDTRINLELPFRTIAECQRLMRASRTGISRRESGSAGFLLRLYVRAADALAAQSVDSTHLHFGSEKLAIERVQQAIQAALAPDRSGR